jgi:hypothetical protein
MDENLVAGHRLTEFCRSKSDRMEVFMKLSKNIVFVHIPKAGGSSVRNFIKSQVDKEYIFPEASLHHFPRYENLHVEGPKLFMSHLGFDFVKAANADAFVLMRHPVERLLSLYSYAVHPGGNVPIIDPELVKDLTLDEFFMTSRPAIRMNIDNAQLWQLASGYSSRHRELRIANGATMERLIQQAKANLECSTVVGTLENMPDFYKAIGQYFGKNDLAPQASVSNISEKRVRWTDLSADQKIMVEACVSCEWQVYDHAKALAAAKTGET